MTTRYERALRLRLWRRGLWLSLRRPVRAASLYAALGAFAGLLHDPRYMLTHPYSLDEAWVADSLRAPLSDLPRLAGSSPLGWAFLLRLVPGFFGEHRARLVPLLFTALLCPLAYALGRELDRDGRVTRWAMAFAAAVLPPAMLRHDLKQYTADAFVAVLLVLLAARAERLATREAFGAFAAAASLGLLVSHTAAFTGAALLAGLLAAFASRRAWRACAEVGVAAAFFGVAVLFDYLVLARRAMTPALREYWEDFFVPGSGGAAFVGRRAGQAAEVIGLGPLAVVVLLLLLGVAALWLRGHRAVAVGVPVLVGGTLVASMLRLYPLWERRTSLYLFAVVVLVVTYGVVAAAAFVEWPRPWLAVVPVVLFGAVLWNAAIDLRTGLHDGDTRYLARLVAERRAPGDLVLVDQRLAYGWAYYWPDRPRFREDAVSAAGFVPYYPGHLGVRVVGDSALPSGPASLRAVVDESPTGTVWVVLSLAARERSYLAEARRLGTVDVLTDDRDYFLLRVSRR